MFGKAATNNQIYQWWRYLSSYIHHVGREPLRPTTLGKVVRDTVAKYPDREALVSRHQNRRFTYEGFLLESEKLAVGLQSLGLQKGDRIGLWAPNLIEWHVVYLACALNGMILVALNPTYQAPELEYCLNKVGIKALLCPDAVNKTNFYGTLNSIISNLEQSQPGKLKCDKVPSLESIITISEKDLRGVLNYEEVVSRATPTSIEALRKNQKYVQADLPLNIHFTSGTTGKPKAAVVTHFSVTNNAYRIGKRNEFDQKHHKICVQVPFFHAFGSVITSASALTFGATLVMPSATYNPAENLTALHEEKCTVIHGTPTMYVDLINVQKKHNLDINPDIVVSGGAPCSPALFKNMKQVLKAKKVQSVYGLTEVTAVAFQSLPINEDMCKATDTVGHIQDHLEAKVVDEEGNVVPIGTPGELCLRGYSIMLGYWDDEDKTKEAIGADKWFRTG